MEFLEKNFYYIMLFVVFVLLLVEILHDDSNRKFIPKDLRNEIHYKYFHNNNTNFILNVSDKDYLSAGASIITGTVEHNSKTIIKDRVFDTLDQKFFMGVQCSDKVSIFLSRTFYIVPGEIISVSMKEQRWKVIKGDTTQQGKVELPNPFYDYLFYKRMRNKRVYNECEKF